LGTSFGQCTAQLSFGPSQQLWAMAQGRSLGEELLDLHNSLQRLQPALSKAFIYMFFKQGLPIGSKLRFHRKFHADPELEAVGNGISTYALQIILPTACHEYHPAADTCGHLDQDGSYLHFLATIKN